MFKRIFAVLTAMCIVLAGIAAAADGLVSAVVSYAPEKGEISVSGTAYGRTSITVAKDGVLPENMTDADNAVIFKQIEANGRFSCVLGMPENADGGKYIVYAACADGEASDSFIYINKSDADLTDRLNAAQGDEFKKLIEDNAETLGIDVSDELYIKNKDNIISMLGGMRFKDIADFSAKYAKTYAMCAIEGEKERKNIERILSKYAGQLGIDFEEDYNTDKRLTDNVKGTLVKKLAGIDYSELADKDGDVDFAAIYKEYRATEAVLSHDDWVSLRKAMTVDFKEDFHALFEDAAYKKIKDKDRVFEKLVAMDRSSMSSIEKSFKKAVAEVNSEQNKNNSGSQGSSSSGGSTGGSGIVTAPAVTPEMRDDKPKSVFSDVAPEHWGSEAINALAAEGIVTGYENGTFAPSNHVTRAEFAKLIVSIKEKTENIPQKNDIAFSDVKDGDWFALFVKKAAGEGLVLGSDGFFRPSESITREDAALIIYRLLDAIGKKPAGYKPFADRNNISDYAKEAVSALGSAKIIQGSGENMFMPKNNITRAEAAQLLYNAFIK